MIPDDILRGLWREEDGSLVDIVALDTDVVAWDRALAFVSEWPDATYTVDGMASAVPVKLDEFRPPGGLSPGRLSLSIQGCIINGHYFDEDEIEFDIRPREVSSDEIARKVLAFAEGLAKAIDRPVHLTPESTHDRPMITFDPSTSRWIDVWVPPI
jgi:hypothetical protein